MQVKMYTDGAAKANPEGPGGYGCILQYTGADGKLYEREYSKGYKKTTNNRMELLAVIVGFEALTKPCTIEVISDSKYVTDAFNKKWLEKWVANNWKTSVKKPVKNIDLWQRLMEAMKPHIATFTWVKGHDGNPMNERCDFLATTAAISDGLLDDVVNLMV